ncbi:MAG TPA: HEPN domain-containing protein [Acidimicrobiales bacterium]|nr:HEPN domain-containing protein [Acidimicrobiales bacterium]
MDSPQLHPRDPASELDLDTIDLEDNDHPEVAVSRSYYAAFYAAKGAPASLGEQQSMHSAVISAFGQLVVKDGADPVAGRALRLLFDNRTDADCNLRPASDADARAAIADARIVVDAVEAWLKTR